MRRVGVLICAVLALFLISSVNPSMSSIPASIVDEAFETPFFTAADGAESSESLTSFSETLDDDAMYYPDGYNGSVTRGDYRNNMDTLDGWFYAGGTSSITESSEMVTANGTATGGSSSKETFGVNEPEHSTVHDDFHIVFQVRCNVTAGMTFYVWMATGNDSLPALNGYREFTLTTADTWYTQVLNVSDGANPVRSYIWALSTDGNVEFSLDIRLLVEVVRWNSYSGYFEDFAGVNDWLIMDDEGDDTFSSDGDLLHFESKTDSEDDGESVYSNVPSLVGQYLEIRYRLNTTSLATFAVGTYSSDGGLAGNINWFGMTITTSWTTSKFPINSDTVIESVRLYIYHVTGQPPVDLQVDYLRIGPSDEMGWAHDGSTTAGVTDDSVADMTYEYSSDGDVLNLTATNTKGSSQYANFYLAFDTTATASDLESSYYPFFAANFKMSISELGAATFGIRPHYDNLYLTLTPTRDGADYETLRGNVAAGSALAVSYVRFYCYLGSFWSVTWLVDWCKAYSIANATVTQSGVGTNDYLYVDSGILYSSIDDGYIELNHDPALSVSDTYSVWNLTTSGTAPEFSQYVSEWSAYSDETRGATTSGTVTDIKLKFDSTEILSAIKFIEDSTAPDIIDKYLDPSTPADDEAVTVTAVAYDAVEVYELTINAIVYPTGFSDVDYSMTETAQEHVFTYDFATLIAGYYLFQITANDGANTYSEYISVRVREAAITISPITFFGVGEDFTQMQMSFDINKDCSYTIYETSASYAEADTHTGSVSEGWSNIAWDKISVVDTSANFSIKFENGSLSTWVNGSYSIAQTTFYVSTVTQMVSLDTVTVTGRITKLGAYQVYDDLDVLQSYGTIGDLDFKIQFTRWGGYDEQKHDFAIKFTNGTQTCWYNSSFYAFKKPVVAAFQTTDPNALYAFQASFWTAVAATFILIMVAIDFYRRYWKD